MAIKATDTDFSGKSTGQSSEREGGRTLPVDRVRTSRTPLASEIMSRDPTKTTKAKMTMPISKREVELTYREIDPEDVWVSPLNPRNQALLSEADPDVVHFRERIRQETQRDPVLVRVNEGPNGQRYELIYGSRRRFVALLEKREHGAFALKAHIGEVGDVDAARLARSENDDRAELSAYERAQDYSQLKATTYLERDQDVMAVALGMSKASLSKYLSLAKVPLIVIQAFVSPSVVGVRHAGQLMKLIEGKTEAELERALSAALSGGRFNNVGALIKALESNFAKSTKSTVAVSANRARKYVGDKVSATLAVKRGKPGQYRVDLAGLDAETIEEIDRFLISLCGSVSR